MATVKSSTMEENQRAVTKELDAVFQDIPLDAPPSLEDRWDHRAANTVKYLVSGAQIYQLVRQAALDRETLRKVFHRLLGAAPRLTGTPFFLKLQMTSPQMTREHLSSQRSSSRASSRKLPTTRVDKPSPIPEVGLSKSADFDKIASNENHVDGKNIDGIDNYRRRRVSWLGTLTAAFN